MEGIQRMATGSKWRDSPASESDEREWIAAARAGSELGMERLFRAHWAGAQRASYLVVRDWAASEDIAQEAFMAAIRSLDRFDRSRPFGPWLHRIVVNRSIDWSRARRSRREVTDRLAPEIPVVSTHDPDPFQRDQLLGALGELTPEHRAVVVLRYLFEYTPGEIAEMLDVRRGTVNSRMRRALDQMAASMPPESGVSSDE